MVKIDKGVPLPNGRASHGGKYPLSQMKIGDSFVVDDPSKPLNNLYLTALGLNMKITIRKIGDGKRRVWRVE